MYRLSVALSQHIIQRLLSINMLFLNIDKVHRTIDLFPEEFEYI